MTFTDERTYMQCDSDTVVNVTIHDNVHLFYQHEFRGTAQFGRPPTDEIETIYCVTARPDGLIPYEWEEIEIGTINPK